MAIFFKLYLRSDRSNKHVDTNTSHFCNSNIGNYVYRVSLTDQACFMYTHKKSLIGLEISLRTNHLNTHQSIIISVHLKKRMHFDNVWHNECNT
jgi:hypothetical protein